MSEIQTLHPDWKTVEKLIGQNYNSFKFALTQGIHECLEFKASLQCRNTMFLLKKKKIKKFKKKLVLPYTTD